MRISEILWKAANEHLYQPDGRSPGGFLWSRQSCCAAAFAEDESLWGLDWQEAASASQAVRFLERLGCNSDSCGQFNEFETTESLQGARYAWLMFASMVAEEQGL